MMPIKLLFIVLVMTIAPYTYADDKPIGEHHEYAELLKSQNDLKKAYKQQKMLSSWFDEQERLRRRYSNVVDDMMLSAATYILQREAKNIQNMEEAWDQKIENYWGVQSSRAINARKVSPYRKKVFHALVALYEAKRDLYSFRYMFLRPYYNTPRQVPKGVLAEVRKKNDAVLRAQNKYNAEAENMIRVLALTLTEKQNP